MYNTFLSAIEPQSNRFLPPFLQKSHKQFQGVVQREYLL